MTESFDAPRAGWELEKTVIGVLADMTFIDATPRPADASMDDSAWESRASIDVLRPMSCRIELRSPKAFLAEIIDILFAGAEDEGTDRDDSVLELLNVVAGSFLTSYFGPGTEIKLELPRYVFFSDGAEGEEIARLDFDAEGFPIRVSLSSIRYKY
jgi:hypothetical protein